MVAAARARRWEDFIVVVVVGWIVGKVVSFLVGGCFFFSVELLCGCWAGDGDEVDPVQGFCRWLRVKFDMDKRSEAKQNQTARSAQLSRVRKGATGVLWSCCFTRGGRGCASFVDVEWLLGGWERLRERVCFVRTKNAEIAAMFCG